jgi:hypothetical protein
MRFEASEQLPGEYRFFSIDNEVDEESDNITVLSWLEVGDRLIAELIIRRDWWVRGFCGHLREC